MNQWRLHIENFGKIAKATIDVSPFMIFVGKNNSGKSYLMVLLWGIISEARNLVERYLEQHEDYSGLYSRIKKMVESESSKEKGTLNIDGALQVEFINLFNKVINKQKSSFLDRVFRHPVSINSLRIERVAPLPMSYHVSLTKPSLTRVESSEDFQPGTRCTLMINDKEILSLHGPSYDNPSDHLVAFIIKSAVVELICHDFYEDSLVDRRQTYEPLYLPASRTGFMHTYRAIVGNLFKSASDFVLEAASAKRESETTISGAELNLPTIEFLTKLQMRGVNTKQQEFYRDEIHFLQDEVFQGQVVTDDKNLIRFIPRNSNERLPLHVTSSLVAELSSISLFLESSYDPTLWIFEEVESHLHTEMQLTVTRFLFRLFNKGKSIWLTTHSDNLAQQINNLITLSRHPEKAALLEKLNYDEKDLLDDINAIRVYQFEVVDGVTEVEPLKLGKYGFEMKTFNNTLDRLIRETHLIQKYAGERND